MFMGSDAQEGFARAMEIHDITFTYGFFIIYLLFFAQMCIRDRYIHKEYNKQ